MKVFYPHEIDAINAFLDEGRILAVPTETVFGLCVKYDNFSAVTKLMKLKQREMGSGKVFALMVFAKTEIARFATVSALAQTIIDKYLPGELTIVLPKNPDFKNQYFDNFTTVGLRVPNHQFLQKLLEKTGALMMTSANLRGEAPARTFTEALTLPMDGIIRGAAGGGEPTTVVAVDDKIKVLRQGKIHFKVLLHNCP
ncbi:MAG: threonylcarbamoyl-AMP synthase [Candidatus Nomurabacteria bacterium]|jgi:L-threonylcarbamoyladenylate synthase|nr:threonylcarbamoyl-AMP synthase [Candidatus Nomurabacteria bacterium]